MFWGPSAQIEGGKKPNPVGGCGTGSGGGGNGSGSGRGNPGHRDALRPHSGSAASVSCSRSWPAACQGASTVAAAASIGLAMGGGVAIQRLMAGMPAERALCASCGTCHRFAIAGLYHRNHVSISSWLCSGAETPI